MGKKMAPGTGLTARQEQLLELALSESYIIENFYLTGGTALSAWYLHHRESYDLDFFSDHPFDYKRLIRWFRKNEQAINTRTMVFDEDFGFLEVKIRYPNDDLLKIDFHHYSPSRLKKGIIWKGLTIDSIYDISVNKLQTISEIPRTRDYVDLYAILKKTKWTARTLATSAARKFGVKTDSMHLAKNFLKVVEYVDLPRMLVPFDRKDMDRFYGNLAISLKKDIFI